MLKVFLRNLTRWSLLLFLLSLCFANLIAGSKDDPPNIVLIVIDALRRDHLGMYGYSEETMPFVAERAKTGIFFTNYFSNASETVTSHGTLFSGLLSDPYESKIDHSFVAELKKIGYRTYGISANPLVSKLFQFNLGFDFFESDPPPEYLKKEFLLDRLRDLELLSGQRNSLTPSQTIHLSTTADLINPRLFSCLEKHISESTKAPFFLFINYLEPHEPYFPHRNSPLRGNYNLRDEDDSFQSLLCEVNKMTPERRSELVGLYDGEIRFVDAAISKLYKWIESKSLPGNTIFIITSDHGEMLGEQNLWTHSLALYSKELEIPMIVFGNNIKKSRIQSLMSHVDTGPLILSLASGSTKNFFKERRNTKIVLQRHRTFGGQDSWRNCLPEMGRVELFRFTGLKTSTLFYQLNGKEIIGVYDNQDGALLANRYSTLQENLKQNILDDIRNAIKKFKGSGAKIDKRIELQLRSLGYIK
jgi:membrane-anchored protein YejM (alkaline phosphatase superfamily)